VRDYLAALVKGVSDPVQAENVAREYLHARILETLQRMGAMISLAFHGGTSLRFLYSIPRYSQDLDFALERNRAGYDFRAYLRRLQADLTPEGYKVEIKVNDQKAVHSANVRFPGLLRELGLSAHPGQVFTIKIEVDTNPPAGAGLTTTVVKRYATLHLQHYDQASLLAGKVHAVLQRAYTKGRDIYDLYWYVSDPAWPLPNFAFLNNALQQTGWRGPSLTADNWVQVVTDKLNMLDWALIVSDVQPFLEASVDLKSFTLATLVQLLKQRQKEAR
jgi:hypothetical protein